MESTLTDFANRHVATGTVPGVVVASIGKGADVEVVTAGISGEGQTIGTDTIFRIQSMSKVVVAVAALRLVESGRVGLDSDVGKWLPELADRQVLRTPTSQLADTDPAEGPITLRHLLTCTSGYGWIQAESPLRQAMAANGTEPGFEPPSVDANEWLGRIAELPLAFHPGAGWRYHSSYPILGILIARISGQSLDAHLRTDLFDPLGMSDTGLWVREESLDRLGAAHRHGEDAPLVVTEPAGGGFYAGAPDFDVSHGELVSTEQDFRRFATMLAEEGALDGQQVISREHCQLLRTDQVPTASKSPEAFGPDFWHDASWGFGVGIHLAGPHEGRIHWAGGQGTSFYVDPDGTIGILLTQVELGEQMWPVLGEFQELGGGPQR